MKKIPYVFSGGFYNYISCGVVGICVEVCLSILSFCLCFKWCHQIEEDMKL